MSALILGGIAVAGVLKTWGANNYRFTESGEQSKQRDDDIKKEMVAMEQRLITQINNCGTKINRISDESETGYVNLSKDAARRHHQISLAVMLIAPAAKEHEVVELLKEE